MQTVEPLWSVVWREVQYTRIDENDYPRQRLGLGRLLAARIDIAPPRHTFYYIVNDSPVCYAIFPDPGTRSVVNLRESMCYIYLQYRTVTFFSLMSLVLLLCVSMCTYLKGSYYTHVAMCYYSLDIYQLFPSAYDWFTIFIESVNNLTLKNIIRTIWLYACMLFPFYNSTWGFYRIV